MAPGLRALGPSRRGASTRAGLGARPCALERAGALAGSAVGKADDVRAHVLSRVEGAAAVNRVGGRLRLGDERLSHLGKDWRDVLHGHWRVFSSSMKSAHFVSMMTVRITGMESAACCGQAAPAKMRGGQPRSRRGHAQTYFSACRSRSCDVSIDAAARLAACSIVFRP